MKILIIAQGSQGDIRPMLALSNGLHAAGHKIALCAPASYKEKGEKTGAVFFPLGPDADKLLEDNKGKMINAFTSIKTVFKAIRGSIPYYIGNLIEIIHKLDGVDLLVGGGVDFTGFTVAEYFNIKYVYIAYFPQCSNPDIMHLFQYLCTDFQKPLIVSCG
jgi:UDP:flavonoid glycosyltransferase YjiC (YdhE family)